MIDGGICAPGIINGTPLVVADKYALVFPEAQWMPWQMCSGAHTTGYRECWAWGGTAVHFRQTHHKPTCVEKTPSISR